MARGTLEAMARGGIYDQLAGGFARYSVDAAWVVPHFEKMLYDNALLLRVYLHLGARTGDGWARRVADETAAFLLRDLGTAEGGFASALDADTEGVEGLTYVWTPEQLRRGARCRRRPVGGRAVRGDRRGHVRARRLHAPAARATRTTRTGWTTSGGGCWPPGRGGRSRRATTRWSPPGTGWPIAALAEHGVLTGTPDSVAAARAAAELLARVHWVDGRLRRASRDGVAGRHAGVLEDYGDLAEGLLALHQATAEGRWLELAGDLLDVVAEQFVDARRRGTTPPRTPRRWSTGPSIPADGPTPAGVAAAAGALVTYAALAGSPRHRELRGGGAGLARLLVAQAPRAAGWAAAVGEALLAGPLEVAVQRAGRAGARTSSRPAARASVSPARSSWWASRTSPACRCWPTGRWSAGDPAAYVCRGFVCAAPVTDVSALSAAMSPS